MTKEEKEDYERLMLAAPDMLEALHEALKQFVKQKEESISMNKTKIEE